MNPGPGPRSGPAPVPDPAPATDPPVSYDAIDLGELLDLIEAMRPYLAGRVDTYDEQKGESEVLARADRILARYETAWTRSA